VNFIGNTALGRDVTLGQDLHFHFFHSLSRIRNKLSFSGPGSDLFFAIKKFKVFAFSYFKWVKFVIDFLYIFHEETLALALFYHRYDKTFRIQYYSIHFQCLSSSLFLFY